MSAMPGDFSKLLRWQYLRECLVVAGPHVRVHRKGHHAPEKDGIIPAPRVLTAWLTRQGVRVTPETNHPSHRPLDHEGRHRYRRARTIRSPQSYRSYRLRQTQTTTVRASCCGMRDTPVAACPAQWPRTAVPTPCIVIQKWALLLPPFSITAYQYFCSGVL